MTYPNEYSFKKEHLLYLYIMCKSQVRQNYMHFRIMEQNSFKSCLYPTVFHFFYEWNKNQLYWYDFFYKMSKNKIL